MCTVRTSAYSFPPDACVLRMFEFPQSIDSGSHTIEWGRPRGQIERRFRFVEFDIPRARARHRAGRRVRDKVKGKRKLAAALRHIRRQELTGVDGRVRRADAAPHEEYGECGGSGGGAERGGRGAELAQPAHGYARQQALQAHRRAAEAWVYVIGICAPRTMVHNTLRVDVWYRRRYVPGCTESSEFRD